MNCSGNKSPLLLALCASDLNWCPWGKYLNSTYRACLGSLKIDSPLCKICWSQNNSHNHEWLQVLWNKWTVPNRYRDLTLQNNPKECIKTAPNTLTRDINHKLLSNKIIQFHLFHTDTHTHTHTVFTHTFYRTAGPWLEMYEADR